MAMPPEAPVFSIVIPTRNGEPYLRETIDSVLSQNYPHFQLFILESGSTDQTVTIANEYAQRDTRIRVVTTDEPLDIQGNWARIQELELDAYLTILGHDDVLYPNFLETIAGLIAHAFSYSGCQRSDQPFM
jgi:glycosyltransferase involved in cell wall biosynthesis